MNTKEPSKRDILKRYFLYHVPLILLSATLFIISVYIGPRTKAGFIALILGSISLIIAPPVSLYLTRKKIERLYKKQ